MKLKAITVLATMMLLYPRHAMAQQVFLDHREEVSGFRAEVPFSSISLSYGSKHTQNGILPNMPTLNAACLRSTPLAIDRGAYLTWGLEAEYSSARNREEGSSDGMEIRLAKVSLPIGFSYRIPLSRQLSLFPYVGLRAGSHVLARVSRTDSTESLFRKNSLTGETAISYFQAGWMGGIGLSWKGWILGTQYAEDITDLLSVHPSRSHAIMLQAAFSY